MLNYGHHTIVPFPFFSVFLVVVVVVGGGVTLVMLMVTYGNGSLNATHAQMHKHFYLCMHSVCNGLKA